MKIAIFDVDDTIILHGNESHNYYTTSNSNFRELLESKNFDKVYLYTNGTWGHGNSIAEHLDIQDMISFIYGRDNLQSVRDSNGSLLYPKHMKPHIESFQFVNSSIQYESGSYDNEVYFFDDLKQNLETANQIGWKTILIKPNTNTEPYINYVFPNIYAALLNLV